MEEIFEMIVAAATVVAAAAGIVIKNAKKSKRPPKQAPDFDWENLGNESSGEPIIPYAPSQPTQPVQLEMSFEPEPEPEHPSQQVMEGPEKPEAAKTPVVSPKPSQKPASAARISAAKLREAVIMSEILGKPAALRRSSGRI